MEKRPSSNVFVCWSTDKSLSRSEFLHQSPKIAFCLNTYLIGTTQKYIKEGIISCFFWFTCTYVKPSSEYYQALSRPLPASGQFRLAFTSLLTESGECYAFLVRNIAPMGVTDITEASNFIQATSSVLTALKMIKWFPYWSAHLLQKQKLDGEE